MNGTMTWFRRLSIFWKKTFLYRFFVQILLWCKKEFKESCIRNYVLSDKGMHRLYPVSWTYCILSFIIKRITAVFGFFGKGVRHLSVKEGTGQALWQTVRYEYVYAAIFAGMLCLPHSAWNNAYAVVAAFILAAFYILKSRGDRMPVNPYAFPFSLLIFMLSVFVGMWLSPSLSDGCRTALFFISGVLFMLEAWGGIQDEKRLKIVVSILLTGFFGMCMMGLFQGLCGVETDRMLTDVSMNQGMPGRVYATMGNPNNFAEIIILLVPFLYAMIISTEKKRYKCLFAVMLAVSVAALAISYSRAGYIALIIGTVVFAVLYDIRLLLPIMLVAAASIPFLPESIMNRIFTIGSLQDTSNAYRIFLWDGAVEMMRDHLFSGVGLGPEAFSAVYPAYAHIHALNAPHSHMLYMELVIELGLWGATAFFVFMGSVFRRCLATMRKASKTLRCMMIAGISSFCGIAFSACVEYIWFYPRVLFVFWMVAGLTLCAVRLAKKNKSVLPESGERS